MAVYIQIPNPRTPDEIAAAVFADLRTRFSGYVPNSGALATILTETFAREGGELWQLTSTMEDSAFRAFGPRVGIDPIAATNASAPSTWTMVDDAGYTISAGTQVGIRVAGDTLIPFRTLNEVTVPPGSTATAAGEVVIVAIDAGAAGSGLGGIGVALELLDPLDFVQAAVLTQITTGGVDAESDTDFMDRLTGEYRLLTRRPILPGDFEILARRIGGVDRALALDGYNPDDETFDNERMIALVVVDASGQPVTSAVKTAVDDLLQSEREVNFVVNVIDATYTTIDAAAAFTIYAGYSGAEVAGRVVAALTSYLSPANWGRPRIGDQHTWLNVTTVRYLELAQIVNNVEGVDYVTSLLFAAAAHKAYTVVAATDVFTSTAHGYGNGDPLLVTAATAGAPLAAGTVYYARDVATDTFKLALTVGGGAVDVTTDGSGSVTKVGTADVTLPGVAPLPEPGVIAAVAA